jgi:uncharacterized membrane protein YeaQ/YmgE (transglycosylase-associated protein family)
MLTALIISLVIGAIAGWLAGLLVQGTGFGLVGDIIVGILGALIAASCFRTWESPLRLAAACSARSFSLSSGRSSCS